MAGQLPGVVSGSLRARAAVSCFNECENLRLSLCSLDSVKERGALYRDVVTLDNSGLSAMPHVEYDANNVLTGASRKHVRLAEMLASDFREIVNLLVVLILTDAGLDKIYIGGPRRGISLTKSLNDLCSIWSTLSNPRIPSNIKELRIADKIRRTVSPTGRNLSVSEVDSAKDALIRTLRVVGARLSYIFSSARWEHLNDAAHRGVSRGAIYDPLWILNPVFVLAVESLFVPAADVIDSYGFLWERHDRPGTYPTWDRLCAANF